MNNEGFTPQEEAVFKRGDKEAEENEALARGEKTVAAKKAKAIEEGRYEEWFRGEATDKTKKF